jgi:hypothetical protein
MKAITLAAVAALTLSAGWACADALSANPPTTMTLCLDGGGRKAPVTCHTQNASRLDAREDVCTCPGATRQVSAPVCAPGVRPPAESLAYARARLKAASHGGLADATWQGQPMCVAPRNLGG